MNNLNKEPSPNSESDPPKIIQKAIETMQRMGDYVGNKTAKGAEALVEKAPPNVHVLLSEVLKMFSGSKK